MEFSTQCRDKGIEPKKQDGYLRSEGSKNASQLTLWLYASLLRVSTIYKKRWASTMRPFFCFQSSISLNPLNNPFGV
jgi:hypothetical protein